MLQTHEIFGTHFVLLNNKQILEFFNMCPICDFVLQLPFADYS